jgi:hypothetical protein
MLIGYDVGPSRVTLLFGVTDAAALLVMSARILRFDVAQ